MIAEFTRRRVTRTGALFSLLLTICAVAGVSGIFVAVEIKKVPVQRLAQNIERQLVEKPGDVALRLNLARLYAMAYALKVTEFDARTKGTGLEPWFGDMPPNMPGPVGPAPSSEHEARAREDLARAIKAYADVVSRAPSNAIARLGYAWSLEQAGEKTRAIAEYRRVVELAWPKERKATEFWNDPATSEAADRLIALLDPATDAKEIASLQEKQAELATKGRMITPIAIPLGDQFESAPVAAAAGVLFDADGSGIPRRWTWIRRDAGWLVYDSDGAGEITSALQWFGNVTFWLFWSNGYGPLRALDDNGDGELRGTELRHLAIWRDASQNGISERGEVRPLSSYAIVALSCDYDVADDPWLAAYSRSGVTFADGSRRPTYDVILRPSRSLTRP